jgi:hypothetical protein
MIERGLWGVTAIATLAAVLGVRSVEKRTDAPVATKVTAQAESRRIDPDSLFQSAAHLASNDPFRLSHQPPSVAYSPALEGLAPPPPVARPPRPNLVLRGVVGGPPWSAVIEGIPGHDGSVLLRKGDTIATLAVRAVGRDTVIIKGADTTWRLTVKRSW